MQAEDTTTPVGGAGEGAMDLDPTGPPPTVPALSERERFELQRDQAWGR